MKFVDPTCPFLIPLSSWPIPIAKTWNLASIACNLISQTQQEVRQLGANIATINKNMHSSIFASIEELKQDITAHLKFVTMMICTKLHILADPPLSDPPLRTKAETSSHSHNFQPHHFQYDLCLLRVDVTKFDGSDPTGWVTQMEHYFSLYAITDELAKLRYGVLHIDQERWQWWQWRKNAHQGYVSWTHFVAELYECFDTNTNHLGCLKKLKQSCIMEDFIASFERLAFRTKGMSDSFF
jgi:hypothetical protein